ncbi:MAG: hypothetical protein OZ921_15935 [Sorangiineae bacterium]|nr:hypothetical protein [Polyangiaceae bacterium]MEB2324003.1 hypothetical protein [Sorangiineae bacterium]
MRLFATLMFPALLLSTPAGEPRAVTAASALAAALPTVDHLGAAPTGEPAASRVEPSSHALAAELAPPSEPALTAEPTLSPSAPVRVQARSGKVVLLPRGCASASGRFDLVVHFHGAPARVTELFERSGLDAVLVVVNLGAGSGPYENTFARPGSLDGFLASVDAVLGRACGRAPRQVKRLALSSWSAGYGATYRILSRASDAARVDAVLLADGLHVGFRGGFRKVDGLQLAPFEQFAAAAARGERLMAISHSAIVPPRYASTTETAHYLLASQGVTPAREREPGPRRGMLEISRGDRGELHVRGFAGTSPDAHADQLYAMGDTVLPFLVERWRR